MPPGRWEGNLRRHRGCCSRASASGEPPDRTVIVSVGLKRGGLACCPSNAPGGGVVLAVGVVVAVLAVQQLVAGEQHRHAAREGKRGHQRPAGPTACRAHVAPRAGPLGTPVAGEVVVGAVVVALAVGLVALAREAGEIRQGEAVVGSDEVDATGEAIAKFVPATPARWPGVAPSGNGLPGSAAGVRASGATRAAGTAPAVVAVVCVLVISAPPCSCHARRLRWPGPRRGGAGSRRRSARSSRSGGRRRSRRRCRRGSTR